MLTTLSYWATLAVVGLVQFSAAVHAAVTNYGPAIAVGTFAIVLVGAAYGAYQQGSKPPSYLD